MNSFALEAPDREIWDEKGGLIKKGAAEIAERDQERASIPSGAEAHNCEHGPHCIYSASTVFVGDYVYLSMIEL